ncbi:hypothetical protein BBJ28_00020289 [Nothophytophthora sp. Chile5]|nr:hypothetical protein BBJ28_00020289 [Nothophytophthora sp. Chile5]
MPALLDFDGENLDLLLTASISSQLTVVLSVESYVGRVRSLADQFRPKTPPASAQPEESAEEETKPTVDDDEDRSSWPSVMLFDQNLELLGVGDKRFRIAASSRDPEMIIVTVTYVVTRAYPTTHQERSVPEKGGGSGGSVTFLPGNWTVSYARQGAMETPVAPGNVIFWPALFTRDVRDLEYTRRPLEQLEAAHLYEFQGERPHDKVFSVGSPWKQRPSSARTSSPASSLAATSDIGLWMALTPRKGICMKLLAAQLGLTRQRHEAQLLQMKKSGKSRGKRKPHFPGQQLNKVAVDAGS